MSESVSRVPFSFEAGPSDTGIVDVTPKGQKPGRIGFTYKITYPSELYFFVNRVSYIRIGIVIQL